MSTQHTKPSYYLEKSKTYLIDTIRIRRHLHQHPELSFEEHQTAAFIEHTLKDYGIITERKSITGVVAVIEGTLPGDQVLALRADIE